MLICHKFIEGYLSLFLFVHLLLELVVCVESVAVHMTECVFVYIVAAVVRFSGFSLLYGCLALVTPLLRRPTVSTMRRMNASVLLCTIPLVLKAKSHHFT